MPTDLYRHYDSNGKLLYVGISNSAIKRFSDHRRDSHWSDDIATMTIQKFDTLDDALSAEAKAIQSENPLHNIAHSGKPIVRSTPRLITAMEIAIAPKGKLFIGGGLLLVKKNIAKGKWVFRYTFDGRRREMGLGVYPTVTLAAARKEHRKWNVFLSSGRDPIESRNAGLTLGFLQKAI